MADREEPVDMSSHSNEFETLILEDRRISIVNDDADLQVDQEQCARYIFPDHWIATHTDSLLPIYDDIKHQACYSSLLDRLDFQTFCEYMDYVNAQETQNVYNWNDEDVRDCVLKYPGKRNPTFKQFVRHNVLELLDLLRYLLQQYPHYKFGCAERFFDVCYDCSSGALMLPW